MTTFSPQSTLRALMAERTPRDYGVPMYEDDQYGCLLSVQICIRSGSDYLWVDVTDDVRSIEWDRGATDTLTQPQVGTCTLRMDNRASTYSMWNTTVGPFAGVDQSLILPNTPMRVGITLVDPITSIVKWRPLFSGRLETSEETLVDNVDDEMAFGLVDIAASLAAHGHGIAMGGGSGARLPWQYGTPVTLPLAVVGGVNDQFKYTTDSLGASEDGMAASTTYTYTMAAGTYSTIAALASAVGAATRSGGHHWSQLATVETFGDALLFSKVVPHIIGNGVHFGGANDVLSQLGFNDGQQFGTFEDIYFGEFGYQMFAGLFNDIDFAFGADDNVTIIDPIAPTWRTAPMASPDRATNRLQAIQDIGTACNVMVYATSAGRMIAVRMGRSVDGATDLGTFTNAPDGSPHNYPVVDFVQYASTDRLLNKVTGQRVRPIGPTFWRLSQ